MPKADSSTASVYVRVESRSCHEEIFAERYAWLRNWALRLSEGDHAEADDLVHNAFLQFVLRRRQLSEIDNLEAYLYGLLRRLRLSWARQALRRRHEPLSAIDYDTAEMCLPRGDVRELVYVKEQLHAVCNYACLRKETSKAASVLILRFFHGFYPKEVAKILRCSLKLANDWLRIARLEARTYLEDPSALHFLPHVSSVCPRPSVYSQPQNGNDVPNIIESLRARIRQARTGECLSPNDVERLYSAASSDTIDSPTLSHLVSCAECLERVTRYLDLGSYSDRDPRDMLGPDGGWRAGGTEKARSNGNGNGASALLRVGTARLRALLEHRPKELLIAANGLPLGTFKVGSVDSELTLAVNLDEPIDFIEVFSEQDVRLLLFEVEPAPHGATGQAEQVDLGEGRSLGLRVEFRNAWPTLHLAYHDPQLPFFSDGSAAIKPVAAEAPSPPVPSARRRRWQGFRGAWRAPFVRPAFGVATVLVAIALWATLPWHGGTASARELLRGASASEQALLAASNTVVHRVLVVEERRPPERVVTRRRRLEVWNDGARSVAARRLYDEQNRLVAGEWTAPDGSRRLYRPGAPPVMRPAGAVTPADADAVWEWEPSARGFAALVGATANPTVQSQGDQYRLQYRPLSLAGTFAVVEATLSIRKGEMRAVAQTLLVRDNGELREYRFAETALANVPASTVPATIFESDPELVGRTLSFDAWLPRSQVEPAHTAITPTHFLSEDDESRLELDVMFALHRLESCLASPVELSRPPNAGLVAHAAATDAGCRARVVDRLLTLGRPPLLEVDVRLAVVPDGPVDVPGGEVFEPGPAYRALIDRFGVASAAGSTGDAPARAARAFSRWALARSSAAVAETRELERLTAAWTPDRLRALDVDRTTMYFDVVRDHARRFLRETEQVREQLERLFGTAALDASVKPSDEPTLELRNADDAPAAVARLATLAANHHTAMRQMFDVAPQGQRVAVDAGALARSLRAGERLAVWFDEPWSVAPGTESGPSPSGRLR